MLVDGARAIPRQEVLGGERVEIDVPTPEPSHLVPEAIPLSVLHEDDDLLLIDKPSGLTVHPGSGQRQGTLANALVHRFRDLPALGGSDRPGIVHRLDKDTSGVMVIARTETAMRALSQAFAERTVKKTYLAVVHGAALDAEGLIDQPIARSRVARTRMTVAGRGGRSAQTSWRVVETLPRHAVLECYPRTGRTHQIRVHLRWLEHPIVGDPLYGWASASGEAQVPRLLLHARRLAFTHPGTGEPFEIAAPPPPAFDAALEALRALPPPRR